MSHIAKGDDLNAKDLYDLTLLHWAVIHSDIKTIKLLISKGVNVNIRDFLGSTPLEHVYEYRTYLPDDIYNKMLNLLTNAGGKKNIDHLLLLSAEKGDVDNIKSLIKEGANVNFQSYLGATPLNVAKTKKVKILLRKAGAKTNNNYALYKAIEKRNYKKVVTLIKKGADVNAKVPYSYLEDYLDVSPLHFAVRFSSLEIVKYLIKKGANVNAKMRGIDLNAGTPLHFAVYKTYYNRPTAKIVKLLILNGADPNAKITSGRLKGASPLHLAIMNSSYELNRAYGSEDKQERLLNVKDDLNVIEMLIESGANINTNNYLGMPPLHLAMEKGNLKVVKMLIKKGADFQAESLLEMTPLFLALNSGYLELVELLINKGVNVNSKDKYNSSPLHISVKGNYVNIVQILLATGANVNIKDNAGNTPLDYAKNDKMKKLLKKKERLF